MFGSREADLGRVKDGLESWMDLLKKLKNNNKFLPVDITSTCSNNFRFKNLGVHGARTSESC